MDNIMTKYIIFAVGIFVTIIILTSVMMAYTQVRNVYSAVEKTNISIKSDLDVSNNIEQKYNDTIKDSVDLINALKMYDDENNIKIIYVFKDETIVKNKIKENNAGNERQKKINSSIVAIKDKISISEGEYLNRIINGEITNILVPESDNIIKSIDNLSYESKFDVEVIKIDNINYIIFEQQ